jgi:hypothetical protein
MPTDVDVKFGPGGIMKHPGTVDYRVQGKYHLLEWLLRLNLLLHDVTLPLLENIRYHWRSVNNEWERKRIANLMISSLKSLGGTFWERDKTTKQWSVVHDQNDIFNTTAKMLDDLMKNQLPCFIRLAFSFQTYEASMEYRVPLMLPPTSKKPQKIDLELEHVGIPSYVTFSEEKLPIGKEKRPICQEKLSIQAEKIVQPCIYDSQDSTHDSDVISWLCQSFDDLSMLDYLNRMECDTIGSNDNDFNQDCSVLSLYDDHSSLEMGSLLSWHTIQTVSTGCETTTKEN